jgi:hypothetical protein
MLVMSAVLCGGCHGASRSALRPATARERAEIGVTVAETWEYESRPPEGLRSFYPVRLRRLTPRPRVVTIRISRADPRYASVLVVRRGARAVLVLRRDRGTTGRGWGDPVAGPALSFPLSCTLATPRGVRDLLCPDPWSRLGFPRPQLRAQTALTQRIDSPDLHSLDWRSIALPGGACGSSRPIRPHRYRYGPAALIHPDVDLVWWNPVVVDSWSKPAFGDLDGDGRDEAALGVVCANGGGTAGGQLAFSEVVFKAVGRSLRVVGILTPRQPLAPGAHVPLSHVVTIERGKVVVSEAWYGPNDGDCCASGRARTIWTYTAGKLQPSRTTILRAVSPRAP